MNKIVILILIILGLILVGFGVAIPISKTIHKCKECKTGVCEKTLGLISTGCKCLDDCSNHGKCDSKGNCVCNDGFIGDNCSKCAPNYFPQGACNVFCDKVKTCSSKGTCDPKSGKCICDDGYTGNNCHEDGFKDKILKLLSGLPGLVEKAIKEVIDNCPGISKNGNKILSSLEEAITQVKNGKAGSLWKLVDEIKTDCKN